jgi:hypothetical protein
MATDHIILSDFIPEPEEVRRRLAVVLTEADLLRSQLRVSERLAQERDRLLAQKDQEVASAPR